MSYFTYILKSEMNGRHYYGSCQDLSKRLASHNAGKVRSTKPYKPYCIIYSETFKSRSEAYRREMFFKSVEGKLHLKETGIL